MDHTTRNSLIAGALAGLAGALAMNQFQRLAAVARGGREADDATIGAPRTGRGPQPAQAIGNASDDATAKVANAITAAAGYPLTEPRHRQLAGEFVHLAFGAANGALYGLAARTDPRVTAGYGIAFGAFVWAAADEGVVPVLGLSRGPREASAGLLAYSFLSHCVYGLTTELVRRRLVRVVH